MSRAKDSFLYPNLNRPSFRAKREISLRFAFSVASVSYLCDLCVEFPVLSFGARP
jgi:hypothetical protein